VYIHVLPVFTAVLTGWPVNTGNVSLSLLTIF